MGDGSGVRGRTYGRGNLSLYIDTASLTAAVTGASSPSARLLVSEIATG